MDEKEISKVSEKKSENNKVSEELRKASEPLLKYLEENHHPHVTVIVTQNSVELLEGIACFQTF